MDVERKILFQALVGSHNYDLNDEQSDVDYKIFTLPTFDDLYSGNLYSKSEIGITADYDMHDVRKLTQLLWKSNINFVEVLFSKEILINKEELHPESLRVLNILFDMRESLARMNLPYLYNACVGMHYSKMKNLYTGTSGTKHLVEEFGWDTKQGLHSYRVLDFLSRYADNDFQDFQQAICYSDSPESQTLLMNIKHGAISIDEFLKLVENKKFTLDQFYKVKYQKHIVTANKDSVECIIKHIVRTELFNKE